MWPHAISRCTVQVTLSSLQLLEHEVMESREPAQGMRAKKYMEIERQVIKQKGYER